MDEVSDAVSAADVRAWVAALRRLAPSEDADRIEVLRLLEELKCSAAGAQTRISRAFEESQLEAQRESGVRARDLGKGIAAQVALARARPGDRLPHPRGPQRRGRRARGPARRPGVDERPRGRATEPDDRLPARPSRV